MEYTQQQMILTKDNTLIFKEDIERILIFIEGRMDLYSSSNEIVKTFVSALGVDLSTCDIKRVTNVYGYKHAVKSVENWIADAYHSMNTLVLVTNMTQFLYSGLYNTWNDKQEKFLIYVIDRDGVFHWVHDLTDRELRAGHNLENIYRNGGFDTDEL